MEPFQYGRAIDPVFTSTVETMTATCRICGRPTTRRVGLTGFCSRHKAEAEEMMRKAGPDMGIVRDLSASFARNMEKKKFTDARMLRHESFKHTRRAQ